VAIRFTPIMTTAISLRLEVEGREASLIFHEHADLGSAREAILIAALIGVWRIGLALTGLDLGGYADLALPEPDYYDRILLIGQGRMRFNQPVHRLVFDASVLDAPYTMADPVVLKLASEQCERILASRGPDASMTARVRSLAMHAKGQPFSLDHIARALRTSSRTLKRQLASEGTTYSALIDEERRERALFLLRTPNASLKDVANRLGYANIANFTRAFQRWTGTTPSEHRAASLRGRTR
jgi:AraC-like DNA-binding protein